MPPWWYDPEDRKNTLAVTGIAVFGLILYGCANVFVLRAANDGSPALLEAWGLLHILAILGGIGRILWKLRK